MCLKVLLSNLGSFPGVLIALLFAGFISLYAATALAVPIAYPISFSTGWNLAGNSLTTPIDVKTSFGRQTNIQTIWKWDAAGARWAFYSASLDSAGTLTSFAQSNNYSVLASINPGEGYWVNASAPVSLETQSGTGFSLVAANLVAGWNLVATGDDAAAGAFAANVGNVTTIWAWDNVDNTWYFHSPALVANGTQTSYIQSKGYKDFGNLALNRGQGFWVNYAGTPAGGGAVTLTSIAVTPANPAIRAGMTNQFTATGTYSDGSTQDITAAVTWASATPTVATVSNGGLATGAATGNASITATAGTVSGRTALSVVVAQGNNWTFRALNARLSSVASSGTKYVAVGDNEVVYNSPDGITWHEVLSTSGIGKVIWTGSQFAGAGSGGIRFSSDGVAWTTATTQPMNAVVWSGTQYVAIGGGGAILTSPDGVTWTSRNSGTTANLGLIVWSGSKFVIAVGNSVISSSDGVTWATTGSGVGIFASGLAYSGREFVVIGGNGWRQQSILTSPDAVTWTVTWTQESLITMNDICWSGTQFVVVGEAEMNSAASYISHAIVRTSPDGVTWTARDSGAIGPLYGISWSGTQYVAVGGHTSSGALILTSPDAVTWASRLLGTNTSNQMFTELTGIASSATLSVAVGDLGTIRTSPDGITWTSQNSGITNSLTSIAWSGTLFAAGISNGGILTSSDGVAWSVRSTANANSLNGLTWSGTQFVAVGANGTILTSPDGIVWTSRTSGTTQNLNGVGRSATQLVSVGAGGTILTSPDGVTWTPRTSGVTVGLNAVGWTGTQYVAVGDGGQILSSPDGINWTVRHTSNYQVYPNLYGIAWSGTQLIVAAGRGSYGNTIFWSADGINWAESSSGLGLAGVVWDGAQFISVGTHGIIQTSP